MNTATTTHRILRTVLLTPAAGLLLTLATRAQDTSTTKDQSSNADQLAFPALENYEQHVRQHEERVKELQRQAFAKRRRTEFERIRALAATAQTMSDPEKALRTLLKAEQAVDAMITEKRERSLLRLRAGIVSLQRHVPPPEAFTLQGIPMRLCRTATNENVYISAGPITYGQLRPVLETMRQRGLTDLPDLPVAPEDSESITSITWHTAHSFCAWLGQLSQAPVTLPTASILDTAGLESGLACWTADAWPHGTTDHPPAQRSRFGIRMMTIWDPAERFGAGKHFGEIPCAHYETLGFRITTPVSTAVQQLITRLRDQQ